MLYSPDGALFVLIITADGDSLSSPMSTLPLPCPVLYIITSCVRSPPPRVGPGYVLCARIDPLRFLSGCYRRRLNQGLVVALGFLVLR